MGKKLMGVYIHIPFCKNICSYCDFPKIYYNSKYVKPYLKALEKEIKMKYKKDDLVDTIYIGGGTPSSLNLEELEILLKLLKLFNTIENPEITFESNLEDLDIEKLKLLKKYNINRISLGMQSNNKKIINFLNRKHQKHDIINVVNNCKKVGINNINVDLMYGIKGQTTKDILKDIELLIKLNVTHISCYSLILEPHTMLYVNKYESIDEDIDYEMYKKLSKKLVNENFIHYEFSNYAKIGFESKHNLKYWKNSDYYGFGMGASSCINNTRCTNTKNITNYLNLDFEYETYKVSKKEEEENFFIFGLRKLDGVNILEFKKKFNEDPFEVFELDRLIMEGKLIKNENNISISSKYIYLANLVLMEFLK